MADTDHSPVLDTGRKYLGKVYAKALIGSVEPAGKTEAVLNELDAFVDEVLAKLPKLEAVLNSPRVPFESKERTLHQALGKSMSPQLLNFLKVLARRGRFDCLRAVQQSARDMFNTMSGRIEVHLTTAEPLDSATRDAVLAKLKSSLKTEIDLKTHVDRDLLGGLLIRVGDTVYDGSLANQLARLKKELVASATQRMRKDGDRFAVAN